MCSRVIFRRHHCRLDERLALKMYHTTQRREFQTALLKLVTLNDLDLKCAHRKPNMELGSVSETILFDLLIFATIGCGHNARQSQT